MKDVKKISELLSEYMQNAEINSAARYHREWPIIAGERLRKVTSFSSFDDHTISVYVKGAAARSLLMLEKERILRDFNKRYSDVFADDIRIVRMQ